MRDLRDYAKRTNVRLVAGFVALLLFVGTSLIFLFYGKNAAITGLICILGGFIPIVLIIGLFTVLDLIVKKANEED